MNLNPSIKAVTLSVLLSPTDSVLCGVTLDEEYANVRLNLEDDQAKITMYPQNWAIYDENVIPHNYDSPTFEEAENDGSIEMLDMDEREAYVSRATEKEIFRQLKEALKKQFEDEMFKDRLTAKQKESALEKLDKAIAL